MRIGLGGSSGSVNTAPRPVAADRPGAAPSEPNPPRRRRVGLWVAITATVALLLSWVVAGSPLLMATEVEVTGVSGADAQEIHRIANAEINQPLVKIDVQKIAEEVQRIGLYSSVSVHRGWPHTILIEAVERRPVLSLKDGQAASKDSQGTVKVIDSDGVIFESVKAPPGMPTAILADPNDAAASRLAVAIMEAISADQRPHVKSVTVATPGRAVVQLNDTEVVWGDASRSAFKATVLGHLAKQGDFSRIDLSAPDTPVTVE